MSSTYIEAIVISCTNESVTDIKSEVIRIDNIQGTDILESIQKELQQSEKQLVKIMSLKVVSKCWGCREDQPNQLAHMDYGGCLYMPSDNEA